MKKYFTKKLILISGAIFLLTSSVFAYKYIQKVINHKTLIAVANTVEINDSRSWCWPAKRKMLNQEIKNLSAVVDKEHGTIQIFFDFPSGVWYTMYVADPILVRIFDQNGKVLTYFVTNEKFILSEALDSYKTKNPNHVPSTRGQPWKLERIFPKGNKLEYSVNLRDLEFAHSVEVGFFSEGNVIDIGPQGQNVLCGELGKVDWSAIKK